MEALLERCEEEAMSMNSASSGGDDDGELVKSDHREADALGNRAAIAAGSPTSHIASGDMASRVLVHVDVCMHSTATCDPGAVKARVFAFVRDETAFFSSGPLDISADPSLKNVVDHANIYVPHDRDCVPFWGAELDIHVYQLSMDGAAEEMADNEEDVVACQIFALPTMEFEGMWENLVFESNLQDRLLNYASTALIFSDMQVNAKIISWNRMMLLHGPPGSGKTSLCKGLAQTLSIRLSNRFPHCQFVEINAHSLFSKWFSESGKLVMKLFQKIRDLIEDPQSLVMVLIDEVESLAAARQAALSGSEPSDSIRVVNALLTQIDQLKHFPNVIICCTSNLADAIDIAFVDRADIKMYIGPPTQPARYEIIRSCVGELIRAGVISSEYEFPAADKIGSDDPKASRLMQLAADWEGLSGRALRRLPFQAQSLFLSKIGSPIDEFLDAMKNAARTELQLLCSRPC